jgi:hypothetical protein
MIIILNTVLASILRSSNGPRMAEQLWVAIKAALERDSKTSQKVVVFLGTKTSPILYRSPCLCCDYRLGGNIKLFNHN